MYNFEIHNYAPELNKVFKNGINITKLFSNDVMAKLNGDYKHNIKVIRKELKPSKGLKVFRLIAKRLDNSKEVRYCCVKNSVEALQQLKEAKQHYNVKGTKLQFNRMF